MNTIDGPTKLVRQDAILGGLSIGQLSQHINANLKWEGQDVKHALIYRKSCCSTIVDEHERNIKGRHRDKGAVGLVETNNFLRLL